jgi:WhiB family redox-sensing transcriptional regulator
MEYEDVVALMTPGGHDLHASIQRPVWMADAPCRGESTSAFVPSSPIRGERLPKHLAEVCARCPVVRDCLEYALDRPELLGAWGGTTDAQRKALRRSMAA